MKPAFPLSDNQLVLTVNNRLKRHLELLDADARKQTGQTIWPTAPLYPINSWFKETYEATWPDRWVLSPLQSKTLWENILAGDPDFNKWDPLSLKGAAREAARAYSLLHQYEITVSEKTFSGTEETKSFYRWKLAYEATLSQLGAIDSAQIISRSARLVAEEKIVIPEIIILAGFDEIVPALQSWINAVQKRGHRIEYIPDAAGTRSSPDLENKPGIIVRPCSDIKSEVIQCARWIRAHYKKGHRMGIVSTRLEEVKTLLERELLAELAPDSIFPWEPKQLPFNVSLGQPLIREPMFSPVLTILTSGSGPLPYQRSLQVLRSPYLVPAEDDENLPGEIETRLIKRKSAEVSLETLRSLTQPGVGKTQKTSRQYKSIKSLLAKWIELQNNKKYQSRKLPSEWAKVFTRFLKSINWPTGNRKLNSREIQAYLEWENRLDQLSTLDPILGKVSRISAAELLKDTVANPDHPFQEQTTEDSPVQVMGLLESAGQSFDGLWVMGCDADVLPEPLSPNPFLPVRIQRKLKLPYASPERQYRFARTIVSRLTEASPNTVFSYSQFKDKQPNPISPLLSKARIVAEDIQDSSRMKDKIPLQLMESLNDNSSIPVLIQDLPKIQGGFRILKNQAECPFRAFSIHRLQADRYQVQETDFEHMERGNIIHLALELIWKKLKNRERLEQLSRSGDLIALVDQTMQEILAQEHYSQLFKTQTRFKELEVERMTNLVLNWLKHELDRSDFKVVAIEMKEKFDFEGMPIRFRADRIDELPDGQKIIIDYKSGKVTQSAWFNEPITDPQLPLYAVHLKPQGIALAVVRKGEFKIITSADPVVPKQGLKLVKPGKDSPCQTWDQLRDYWDQQLKTLATGFKKGETAISPVQDETTCRNCHHASLCRIDELRQRLDSHS